MADRLPSRAAAAASDGALADRPAAPLRPAMKQAVAVAARALKARDPRRQAPDQALSVQPFDGRGLVAAAAAWKDPGRVTRTVWFDHTDLAHYFSDNRTPTGIQRVEIELYRAARRRVRPQDGALADACAFDIARRCWVALPRDSFDILCGLGADGAAGDDAKGGGDALGQADWDAAVLALRAAIALAPPASFRRDDVLVTVGASWWIPDYLTFVRHLRQERGVLYAPFVHDCIPLLMRETCAAGLVVDFEDWFAAAMHAADIVFANSRCTARDIVTCAEQAGLPAPAPHVVRLDAHAGAGAAAEGARAGLTHARLGVRNRFALFVATIEARKDHIFVFRCWQEMILRYGADAVPDLLCVGKHGWLVEFTLNWLQVNPQLSGKIRLLGTVTDADLAGLYATAEFCVYNSHYEGWGLPVTESLCHGRVPIVPHHSSLPEAGGGFAAYFEPQSTESFIAQVTRLLDPAVRAGLERRIRSRFRPRPWAAVMEQIVLAASRAPARERSGAAGVPLEAGGIYSFARRTVATPRIYGRSGRMLLPGALARFGAGWWTPEEWGCWSRTKQAHLLFSLAGPERNARSPARELAVAEQAGAMRDFGPQTLRPHMIYVVLRGGPVAQMVEMEAGGLRTGPVTLRPHKRELMGLSFGDVAASTGDVLIGFTAEPYTLADHTDGRDPRQIGFGLEALAIIASDDIEARTNILELAIMPT